LLNGLGLLGMLATGSVMVWQNVKRSWQTKKPEPSSHEV